MSSLTTPPSYLERGAGLTYHGTGHGASGGTKVDSSASYPPHGSVFSSTQLSASTSRTSQSIHTQQSLPWLSQKIESLFGSQERFENKLVLVSRLVVVDCVMYPFTVFSHQCQFYPYNTVRASLTAPFSTLVTLNNIANTQGIYALWRGWKSNLLLMLAQPFLDALLVKLFYLSGGVPGGLKYWLQMVVIKSFPYLVTIPLISYTYHDMVQTTKDKVHVTLGESVVDRPLLKQDELRRLPVVSLAAPTILHGLVSSALSIGVRTVFQRLFANRTTSEHQGPLTSAVGALWLDYFSMFVSDLLLYPLETILVRLYCQGMPALADNVQNGVEQTFVSSYYSGMMDCVLGVYDSEGVVGFFKGFSSVLIRYTLHGLLLLLLWRTAHTLENRLRNHQ